MSVTKTLAYAAACLLGTAYLVVAQPTIQQQAPGQITTAGGAAR